MKKKSKQGIKTFAKKTKKQYKTSPKNSKKSPHSIKIDLGRQVTGKIEKTKSGMGYLVSEHHEKDIFIPKKELKYIVQGDKVRAEIVHINKSGKPEGRIVEVVERYQDEFIGKLQIQNNTSFVILKNPLVEFDIYIPKNKLNKAQDGQNVLVKVIDWNADAKNPEGEVIQILDNERENQIAMKEILLENGFKIGFSKTALKETEKLNGTITDKELKKRKDCRDILTFTIDPVDAKDFDDAISYRKLKNGMDEIGVHIADVSHFITPNSELDKEAYNNATSVYLPDRVLPMLPEKISNELCSLRPNEDKYTFSIIFQIDEKKHIKQYWIGRTVIHSNKRYTYEEVQDVIEGKVEDENKEIILHLNELTQFLRKERFKSGATNFSSIEHRFILGDDGVPTGIQIKESKAAHQLIEELMLLANKYVAQFVDKIRVNQQKIPFPYRIHPEPDELKIEQFAQYVRKLGFEFASTEPDQFAHSVNKLFEQIKGKPEEAMLQELGIRTMAKAIYTPDNEGHYGLGFTEYCHFTSPIRRYPDVMVHRIMQNCLDKKYEIDKKMAIKCKHCSDRERKAMESERHANKYKQAEFMRQYIGEEFEAIVSGVSINGFWAETIEHMCEGMVPIDSLSHLDTFDYFENDFALKGRFHGIKIRIGDKIIISVVSANVETRQIEYDFVKKIS